MLGQKRPRVPAREVLHVGRFEGGIGLVGENGKAERGLARLPRSGDRDDRELPGEGAEPSFEDSSNHGEILPCDGPIVNKIVNQHPDVNSEQLTNSSSVAVRVTPAPGARNTPRGRVQRS